MKWICSYCRERVLAREQPAECDNCGGPLRRWTKRDGAFDEADEDEHPRFKTPDLYPGFLAFIEMVELYKAGALYPRECRWCSSDLLWWGSAILCSGTCDLPNAYQFFGDDKAFVEGL